MPTLVTGRRLWWGVPSLLVLLACLGALLPQAIPNIPEPGAAVSVALPVVRLVRDIAAAMTVGCLVVGGLLLPAGAGRRRAIGWSFPWAFTWLVALLAQTLLTLADVLAMGVRDVLDPTILWSFLTSVLVGKVFLWQSLAVVLVLLLGRVITSVPTAWVVVLIATAGAAAPAFVGHGGLTGGHAAATISLALHLAAISVWLGGLVVVVTLVRLYPGTPSAVVRRFSPLALACVVLVAESGLLNASLRLTSPALILRSDYGALVLVKSAVLLWLVLLGWQHRQRLLPTLTEGRVPSWADLVRIAGWEFLAMGAAVAVGVTLTRVGPESAVPSTSIVNPLSVAMLGAALPLGLACALRPGDDRRWVSLLRRSPEIPAVVLAVVVLEVAAVGLPTLLFGADLGAVVGALSLVGAGWVMAIAMQGERRQQARVAAIVAWVVSGVGVAVWVGAEGSAPRLTLLALVMAVGCCALVRPLGPPADHQAAAPAEVSGV